MNILLHKINDAEFKSSNKTDLDYKYNVLISQIEELKKANYDVNLVYNYGAKLAEN